MPRAEGEKEILVVENDVAIGTLLSEMLKFEGYNVRLTDNVPDALEQLRSRLPDLLFLDWVLPQLSGQDLLIAIDKDPLLKSLPIVIVTAVPKPEQIVKDLIKSLNLEVEVRNVISKPFEYEDITDAARGILNPGSLSQPPYCNFYTRPIKSK